MKNTLTINFENKTIIMDRTFAAKAKDTRSDEYLKLQSVRKDYPDYLVTTRRIKRAEDKNSYKGLTYAYMEEYILKHGSNEEVQETLGEYRKLRDIARCQGKGKGYPVIKEWFLDKYNEIADFGNAA